MIEHFKPVIVKYYEDIFLKYATVDEKNSKTYTLNLKKLYQTIKKLTA